MVAWSMVVGNAMLRPSTAATKPPETWLDVMRDTFDAERAQLAEAEYPP